MRRAINLAMTGLAKSLRSYCWLVEGSGFHAAMVRGVLNGIRMFSKHPYPTFITQHFDEALSWTLPHLGGGNERLADIGAARDAILKQREANGFARRQ